MRIEMAMPKDTLAKGVREMGKAFWVIIATAFQADPWRATLCLLVGPVGMVVGAASPVFTRAAVDHAVAGRVSPAVVAAVLSSVVGFSQMFTMVLQFGAVATLNEKTNHLLERRMIELAALLPGLEHHERPQYADRLALLRGAGQGLSQAATSISMTLGAVGSLATTIVLLGGLDRRLLVLPLFGLLSMVAYGTSQTVRQRALARTGEPTRLGVHLFQLATMASPAKELRIFGLREEVAGKHDETRRSIHATLTRAGVKASVVEVVGWAFFSLGYAGALVLMARRAIAGTATPGDVVMAVNLTTQVNSAVSMAVGMVSWLVATLHIVLRYRWLVRYSEENTPVLVDSVPVPDRIERGIDLRGVSFRYPGTDKDILRDVDLHVPPGATLAIVGENGAGKTTLVKLLARFYEPTAGTIEVDGVDLRRMDVDEWRTRMSAAFQDYMMLELTARDAVGVGNLERIEDRDEIVAALERASATDVLEELPDGLDTQLGRSFADGVELSGGQWQKLALGRAMMRTQPLLLLLDEPTASLDAETEHALFERYSGAAREAARVSGAITVLVSHRFSTVRMADLIVVIEDGLIAEYGSHDELMAQDGRYAELYSMQARAYR